MNNHETLNNAKKEKKKKRLFDKGKEKYFCTAPPSKSGKCKLLVFQGNIYDGCVCNISFICLPLSLFLAHKYLREVLSDIQEFRTGGAKSK